VPPSTTPSKLLGPLLPVAGHLIDATTQFLDSYTDEQLGVINDFLTRMREITASHADTLAREPRLRQSPARPGVRTRRPRS